MSGPPRFEFVDDVTSDLSFVARGATLPEVFGAAAAALLDATLEDPEALGGAERRPIQLEEPDLELLLLAFLNELVYLRDARGLLMRPREIRVEAGAGGATLRGELVGERIDPTRHRLVSDVKAATAYGLRLVRDGAGFRASVTLDV